jgi:hypothetical protein
MHFEHRGFSIECSVEVVGPDYVGQAIISHLAFDEEQGKAFKSGSLRSFPTQAQAIGYARFWAEMWCDERQNQ